MDLDRYLQRIGFTDSPHADITTLKQLQHNHVFNIPFENLDIYCSIPIALDTRSIYEKIVLKKRGGYCYELNGLFYELLVALGFKVSIISCRVANAKGYGPEFDHMALLVKLGDEQWLVDVGYGDFSIIPLILKYDRVQNDGRNNYIITDNVMLEGKKYISVGRWNGTRKLFVPEYIFTTTPQEISSFANMHHYHQNNPQSHFVHTLLCSLPTEAGRVSIVNNRIIETVNDIKKVIHVKNDHNRQLLLKHYFNIEANFSNPICINK